MAKRPSSALRSTPSSLPRASLGALRCRRKFLRFYPEAFEDPLYRRAERSHKWAAHEHWREELASRNFKSKLRNGAYLEIAAYAVQVEARTNLLYSFEKMALRECLKSLEGARLFAEGLHDFLYGEAALDRRFDRWAAVFEALLETKSHSLQWPLLTIFPFIAEPRGHILMKPNITLLAAQRYGYNLLYHPSPNWESYQSLLNFADAIAIELRDLGPRDMIDIQSYIAVQGSSDYEELE